MVTCVLGEKTYTIDFVTGRALRELGDAETAYKRLLSLAKRAEQGEAVDDEEVDMGEVLDTLVKWFCILFQGQFTPDEVFDGYPADDLTKDIVKAVIAVQQGATGVLVSFPSNPTARKVEPKEEAVKPRCRRPLWSAIRSCLRQDGE